MSIIENKLISNSKLQYLVDDTLIDLTIHNIDKYYKYVYVLVKKNKNPIPSEFYNLDVEEKIYNIVLKELIIYKVSILVLLKNQRFFNNVVILSDLYLKQFNIFDYKLEDKNIVLPILNINYIDLSSYLKEFEIDTTIEQIYKMLLIKQYFESKESLMTFELTNNINDMKESNYWCDSTNCNMTFNDIYKKRRVFFDIIRLTNKQVADNIQHLFKSDMIINSEDYLQDMSKDKYIDISALTTFKLVNKIDFSFDNYNKLFDILNDKNKILLFMNSMISREYFHLAINNKYILENILPNLKPLFWLFKYLLSYSWFMFYQEECMKKDQVKTNDRFIFDINTASLLPVLPFIHTNPRENPYMPLLISDKELFAENNIGGIPEYYIDTISSYKNGGICNLSEFKYRMNLFCMDDSNYDLFEDFDFQKYNIAISGSLMCACLQRNNPLMNIFRPEYNKFIEYFDEFYSDSDIDVMFIAKDNKTFIDNVNIFYKHVSAKILNYNSKYKPENINLILKKVAYLFVSESFIIKNITNDKIKLKWIKNNINSDEVIELFKPYYDKIKKEKYDELIKDLLFDELEMFEEKYPEIYKNTNDNIKIYINNKNDYIDLVYTYKYNITSIYLKHPFELFKIKYDDFMSSVSQFHLPCVRSYYNGNVYLTPSCISAHLTYMNIDYKYVSGSTDIFEIINKYRYRGFGTWLNRTEFNMMNKYCNSIPLYKNYITFSVGGVKCITDIIYRRKNHNKYINMSNLPTYNQLSKISYNDILLSYNKSLYLSPFYNITFINRDGFINPLKKWLIDMTIDLIKK